MRAYFRRVPQWAKYSGVALDADDAPSAQSLQRAAQDKVMVEIRIADGFDSKPKPE